jgi:hypothetical protein
VGIGEFGGIFLAGGEFLGNWVCLGLFLRRPKGGFDVVSFCVKEGWVVWRCLGNWVCFAYQYCPINFIEN